MFEELSPEELIEQFVKTREAEDEIRQLRHGLQVTLVQYMEDIGATEILRPEYTIRIDKGSPKTDMSRIPDLIALAKQRGVPQDVLDKAYMPAHSEVVEISDKVNRTYLKTFGKYGADLKQGVEASAIYPDPTIKIEEKKDN